MRQRGPAGPLAVGRGGSQLDVEACGADRIHAPPPGATRTFSTVDQRQAEGLGDAGIDHLPLHHVQAQAEGPVILAGLLPAVPGQPQPVGEGGVGQREGRGARHPARHVGHGVVQDPVDEVGRVLVRGRLDGLDAAALVHRHVHDDRARLHDLEIVALDQVGRLGAREQDGAHHEVGPADGVEDVVPVGVERSSRWPAAHRRGSAAVRARCPGSSPGRPSPAAILAALMPTTPPPMITTSAGGTPGTPPSRTPLPPKTFSRYLAPSCTAMRPATSDIGVSSGQFAVGELHRLVGHRNRPRLDDRAGELLGCGEVEVGVDHLARPASGATRPRSAPSPS